ncbi:Pre-mRNA-splicing factor CWC25 [Nakaseomyces bracarensis]|uniref:Pre-mRNA-splicing factor CWC25 n=1 Tax=Nakaseomyces bracarensis TaxID=273131 RepID=A0ABR4NYB4_9SACH
MGTGDLNLLKSWNPKLVKNRKKVWEREQELLNEDEQLKRRQREIEQEQEEKELLSGRDSKSNTNPKKKGMEWMYQDDPYEKEDYLLGKKKLDSTVIHRPETETKPALKEIQSKHKDDSIYSKDDPMAMFSKKVKKINKVTKPSQTVPKDKPSAVKQINRLEPCKKVAKTPHIQHGSRSSHSNEKNTSDIKRRIQEELDY